MTKMHCAGTFAGARQRGCFWEHVQPGAKAWSNKRKSIGMNRQPGTIFGSEPRGPREIRLDLSVEQLSRHLDFDKGMLRKYIDLLKVKLKKEFPNAKIKVGMRSKGEPAWWLSNDDGTALAKCLEILASVDKMNEPKS
jgi:hypothetical protein